MKIFLFLFSIFLIFSCDKLGELTDSGDEDKKEIPVEEYLPPIINSFNVLPISPGAVTHGDTVRATVNAENPESGILTYDWHVSPVGGTFLQPRDTNIVLWVAPFSNAFSSYDITVTVRNEKDETTSSPRKVTVESTEAPVVTITQVTPEKGTYLQGDIIIVTVNVYHINSIRKVWLKAGDTFVDSAGVNFSNQYDLTFRSDNTYIGRTMLTVIAEANNEARSTGGHAVFINIAGILTKEGITQK